MNKICVEYSSNNSGGRDWLTTDDWQSLRDAGWLLMDYNNPYYENGNYVADEHGLPRITKEASVEEAKYAYKMFIGIYEAIQEFEKITNQDVSHEGCNCCGAPHSFTWGKDIINRLPKERLHEQDYNYASGEELLKYIYEDKDATLSKRELLDKMTKK